MGSPASSSSRPLFQFPPVNSYEDEDEDDDHDDDDGDDDDDYDHEQESPLDDSEPPARDLQHDPPAVEGEQPAKKQSAEEISYASYVQCSIYLS